ncbi:MAG: hypothetical protein KJ970_18125 [Candidatus Eisenbacteria bacterium]|uniref:Uncharacterized protein n=1 Tax=Eiseniibacteriota bacterium TaxID=2212470 RepID=A0A948RXH5_UNCEI|nr:hypothetical protein [Candidatus Eisenbacteria bacterium]MBU1948254.1 hypothetical protein [Candidatus Eisenbacteria bacterium]MBU2692840.1 hypothetical protein [Candidatus Eisenbacteria bacterium]
MSGSTRKSILTQQRRRLLELMQQISFGKIEDLTVRSGEPVLDPPPRVVREIRLGRAGPGPGKGKDDFLLKRQVVELFDEMTRVGNGRIERIDIQGGLPFRVFVAS